MSTSWTARKELHKEEGMNWYDMTPDEQEAFIQDEAAKIARWLMRKAEKSGRYREKKMFAHPGDMVAERVFHAVKKKIALSL